MTKSEQLAWAAGFFDGEGSTFTSVRKDNQRMMLTVSLVQRRKGEVLVTKFQTVVGVGNVSQNERMSMWYVHGYEKATYVVDLLRPYLSEPKLEQATQAFERYLAYDGKRCERWPIINKS